MLYRTSSTASNECYIHKYSTSLSFHILKVILSDFDQEVSRRKHEGDNQPLVHQGTAFQIYTQTSSLRPVPNAQTETHHLLGSYLEEEGCDSTTKGTP